MSVSHIGEGLSSCANVPELLSLTSLRSLCLHGNNITRIEAVQQLHGLQDLNLSSNCITNIENLGGLVSLNSINLASNRLVQVSGLDGLTNLTYLNLSYNNLSSISGLSVLHGPNFKLRCLDLRHNQLDSLQAFSVLVGCINLREISIKGNPVASVPNHQQVLVNVVPQISQLDGISTPEIMSSQPDMAAAQQFAAERLRIHDAASDRFVSMSQHQDWNLAPGTDLAASQLRTPHVDAVVAGYYQRQQGGQQVGGFVNPNSQQQQSHKQPANWYPQHQIVQAGGLGGRRSKAGEGMLGDAGRATDQYPSSQKVYIVDAAVQTIDVTSTQTRQLQAESLMLKQQLIELTDELERRNVLEEQTHQEMQAAILTAQEEAHSRIEGGYKEASQAVSRALQELEACRKQGQLDLERLSMHVRLEEEAKAKCAALQQDVSRLQQDVFNLSEKVRQDNEGMLTSKDEEKKRSDQLEQKLRQQVIALEQQLRERTDELSDQCAAMASVENRASTLDAALHQANSSTASMAARIAQAVTDANVQADGLKSKLSIAEQQLADLQRREVEARAEINMLTSSMSSQQQQHHMELERRSRTAQEELQSALHRERVASEERGKASVLIQAEREKGALQEQLAFLKVQLQYALKESEKESLQLQEQVSMLRSEAQELRSALHAAATRHQDHESLVADMTHVLQQQKAHIQTLQRDKDATLQQLRASAPERVERLQAEVQMLRKANSELDVLREQALHYKKAWQESERKQLETQSNQGHMVEEIQAKLSSMEVALTSAREETRGAVQRADGIAQQLSSAEDAVKVKRAMLDSANDTIEQLKAEIADMQGELEDARRMAEDMESQLRTVHEQDGTEKSNLRAEIEAGESALEQVSTSLSDARSKQQEAETKLKAAQQALSDKEAMINYVNEEVDRVKGMFEKREGRLREERDASRQQADVALRERDATEHRVKEVEDQLEAQSRELKVSQSALSTAQAEASASRTEVSMLTSRLAEAEDEMKQLLVVVEQQKHASANKMKQLAVLLKDL